MTNEKEKKIDTDTKYLIRIETIKQEFYAEIKGLDFIKNLPDTEENKKIKEKLDTLPWYVPALIGWGKREGSILMLYTTDPVLADKIYLIFRPPYNYIIGQYVKIAHIDKLTEGKTQIVDLMDASSKAEYTLYFPPQAREYKRINYFEFSKYPMKFTYFKNSNPDGIEHLPLLGD
ncbi:MAG: hypothetical protein ACP5TL_03275 [Candidatus Micrarchaeia archaeon]